MSTKTAPLSNGQRTATSLRGGNGVDFQPDDDLLRMAYAKADPIIKQRVKVVGQVRDAYESFGANPLERLPEDFKDAYVHGFDDFDPDMLPSEVDDEHVRQWASVHLANTKLKLIGKNGELDILLAATLTCSLIGLTGFSGTGKTASINLMLRSIAKAPNAVNVVDCGTVYSKDQLIGHVDDDGQFVPGLINGDSQFIVLDEFSRMHGTLQSAVVKLMDEGEIHVDGRVHKLHPNFKIFVVYNGQEDGGTFGIIQAILDRLQVVISYKHVDRVSTKVNGRLTNANKDWKADVDFPDDKFRGLKLLERIEQIVERSNGEGNRIDLVDLLSEAVSESREGDFWAPGSQLSERATAILGRIGNALMAVRGITSADLKNQRVLFGLAREVLKSTAYNQLQKNVHREETKDELFEMFLNETFRKFRPAQPISHRRHTR